jgi:hypothetical protein
MNAAIQLLRPIHQHLGMDQPALPKEFVPILASVEAGTTMKDELIALRRALCNAQIFNDDDIDSDSGKQHPTKQQDVVDVLSWALRSFQTFEQKPEFEKVEMQFASEAADVQPYPQAGTKDDATDDARKACVAKLEADLALKSDAQNHRWRVTDLNKEKIQERTIQRDIQTPAGPVFIKTEGKGKPVDITMKFVASESVCGYEKKEDETYSEHQFKLCMPSEKREISVESNVCLVFTSESKCTIKNGFDYAGVVIYEPYDKYGTKGHYVTCLDSSYVGPDGQTVSRYYRYNDAVVTEESGSLKAYVQSLGAPGGDYARVHLLLKSGLRKLPRERPAGSENGGLPGEKTPPVSAPPQSKPPVPQGAAPSDIYKDVVSDEDYRKLKQLAETIKVFEDKCHSFDKDEVDFSFGLCLNDVMKINDKISQLDAFSAEVTDSYHSSQKIPYPKMDFDGDAIDFFMGTLQAANGCSTYAEARGFASGMRASAATDGAMSVQARLSTFALQLRRLIYPVLTPERPFKAEAEALLNDIKAAAEDQSPIQHAHKYKMRTCITLMEKNIENVAQALRELFAETYIAVAHRFEADDHEASLSGNSSVLMTFVGRGYGQGRDAKRADILFVFERLLDHADAGAGHALLRDFVSHRFLLESPDAKLLAGAMELLITKCRGLSHLHERDIKAKDGLISIVGQFLSDVLRHEVGSDSGAGSPEMLTDRGKQCPLYEKFWREILADESKFSHDDGMSVFVACQMAVLTVFKSQTEMLGVFLYQSIVSAIETDCGYWVAVGLGSMRPGPDRNYFTILDDCIEAASTTLIDVMKGQYPRLQALDPLTVSADVSGKKGLYVNPIVLDNIQFLESMLDSGSTAYGETTATFYAKILEATAGKLDKAEYRKYVASDQVYRQELKTAYGALSKGYNDFFKYYKPNAFSDFRTMFQRALLDVIIDRAYLNAGVENTVKGKVEEVHQGFSFFNKDLFPLLTGEKDEIWLSDFESMDDSRMKNTVGLALSAHKAHDIRVYTKVSGTLAGEVITRLIDKIKKTPTDRDSVFPKITVYQIYLNVLEDLSQAALTKKRAKAEGKADYPERIKARLGTEATDLEANTAQLIARMIGDRLSNAGDLAVLYRNGYGLTDAIERLFSYFLYDAPEFVRGFNHLNARLPGVAAALKFTLRSSIEGADFLGEALLRKAARVYADYKPFFEANMVDVVQYNQALALQIIEANSDRNVFLKVGTGQGKSFIIGISAKEIAATLETPDAGHVFVLTSYSHLAQRDEASMRGLYQLGDSGVASLCIDGIDKVALFSSRTKIIHADTKDFTRVVRKTLAKVMLTRGTSEDRAFLKAVYDTKNHIILDEYDLLLEDLREEETNGPVLVSDLGLTKEAIPAEFPRLSRLSATSLEAAAVEVDAYDNREEKNVVVFDGTNLRLFPGFFSFTAFIKNSHRVIGLSGSTTGADIAIHNEKESVVREIPLFNNPQSSSSVDSIEAVTIRSGLSADDLWVASVLDDIEMARNVGAGEKIRPILIFAERLPGKTEKWDRLKTEIKTRFGIDVDELYDERKINDQSLQTIGLEGRITLTTGVCGRGADIRVSKDCEKGLHVLITYMPLHARLKDQMIGRTGRMGQAGSYSMLTQTAGYPVNAANATKLIDLHDQTKAFLQGKQYQPSRADGIAEICTLSEPRLPKNSLLICIDGTASMGPVFDQVKGKVMAMLQTAFNKCAFSAQLMIYRSSCDYKGSKAIECSEWTNDYRTLADFFKGKKAEGGAPNGEAVPVALYHIYHQHTVRGLTRAILIGDDFDVNEGAGCRLPAPDLFAREDVLAESVVLPKITAGNVPIDTFWIDQGGSFSDGPFKAISLKTKGDFKLFKPASEDLSANIGDVIAKHFRSGD